MFSFLNILSFTADKYLCKFFISSLEGSYLLNSMKKRTRNGGEMLGAVHNILFLKAVPQEALCGPEGSREFYAPRFP